MRYEYPEEHLAVSRKAIARYLNAPIEACVFVSNATTGLNTVLRNLVFRPGDVIIYFATIYGAIGKTVNYITETTPATSKKIEYTYPVSDDYLCGAFESTVKDLRAHGKNPKIAIFDTIVSMPGVRMPFERLTKLCQQHKVLSCIDGAHGVGQIPLNLSELDPDFFVSNCHKWLYVPRGCAIFYVPLRNQQLMRSTLPTSHGFVPLPGGDPIENPLPPNGMSEFENNFAFIGTMDNSPYLCITAALQWRSKLTWHDRQGEDAIFAYLNHLAREGGKIVRDILGTEILENEEGTLGNCSFTNVRLPLSVSEVAGSDSKDQVEVATWLLRIITEENRTSISAMLYGDAYWVRLSSQVYLTVRDFETVGELLENVCGRIKQGEWRSKGSLSKL